VLRPGADVPPCPPRYATGLQRSYICRPLEISAKATDVMNLVEDISELTWQLWGACYAQRTAWILEFVKYRVHWNILILSPRTRGVGFKNLCLNSQANMGSATILQLATSLYMNTVCWKKSFLSTESDTKILQSIYFAYKVGIISSYSNRNHQLLFKVYIWCSSWCSEYSTRTKHRCIQDFF